MRKDHQYFDYISDHKIYRSLNTEFHCFKHNCSKYWDVTLLDIKTNKYTFSVYQAKSLKEVFTFINSFAIKELEERYNV